MAFKKGYTPHNKGVKGFRTSGSFKKGMIPWNKGIPHSDETKDKIKKARANQMFTEEHIII